ncbi:hypothetical protein [Enterococcus sp. DIV0806c]|uniref:hypothetical protein n=1 Tax=unclassified Enterococcus TaxID=2608891 RepID=UPI003F24B678
MKKVVFSLVCLLGFLSAGLLGPKVQATIILPENTSSITDVPINTPRVMSSVNTNNDFNSMLYLNQTKSAGWYYPTMQKQREPWYDQIVFEKSPRGLYIRVLHSKENDDKLYFNISNRGYVYLDRKENAREFSVTKLPSTNNLNYDTFRITDLSTGQSLGIYNNYITIGSGTIRRNWIFV